MPRIGKRMIKSAVAVFICLLIYLLRGQEGMPFYSAVVALLCIQAYTAESVTAAINRVIATFLGGFMGMMVLLFERAFIPSDMLMLQYILVSAMMIPIIYITVLLRKTSVSYISCVVFLSIAIVHAGDVSPYAFPINRMIDTLIGIAIALALNSLPLLIPKNKQAVFIIDVDAALTDTSGRVSQSSIVKFNQMVDQGANIVLTSSKSPLEILPAISGLQVNHPIVCMSGAVLYDKANDLYCYDNPLSLEATVAITRILDDYLINRYTYSLIHDFLHIYHHGFTNEAEKDMYQKIPKKYQKNYIDSSIPLGRRALLFQIINTEEKLIWIQSQLKHLDFYGELTFKRYPYEGYGGFMVMEIAKMDTSLEWALSEVDCLTSRPHNKMIVFGSKSTSGAILKYADLAYLVDEQNSPNDNHKYLDVKKRDAVLNRVRKLFYKSRQ